MEILCSKVDFLCSKMDFGHADGHVIWSRDRPCDWSLSYLPISNILENSILCDFLKIKFDRDSSDLTATLQI